MNYINRTIENQFNKANGNFPVLLVTGSRQSGKSTLLEYISSKSIEKVNYVSLDDLMERAKAIEDPENFLRAHETPLIIDEFQYAPNLLSYIKIKVDEARKNALFGDKTPVGTMYYLTGSQVFNTMKTISESLAGRVAIFDLYPLSSREIANLNEQMKKGTPSKSLI